jgi:hypothetical protein
VSTAIFNGRGTSKESGVESRPRNVIAERCGQHGLASRTMRRNNRPSDFEVEVSKPIPNTVPMGSPIGQRIYLFRQVLSRI